MVSNRRKGNCYCWHWHFKAFLSCQDLPDLHQPSYNCDTFPYWKDRPLLQWINFISVEEMTICCKGTYCDILCITYKNEEGNGFQSGVLCQEGFYHQHYMRNEPPPLHSRVLWLFDSLKDDHHHCGMGNLYNSTTFFVLLINMTGKYFVMGYQEKDYVVFQKLWS